mmetsp:Transcript_96677/g.215440  ORF Transcript_96677/g.215440 Transcript_96677/m.215440 type:complete len:259 (+) Transcript_96677:2-778(+)
MAKALDASRVLAKLGQRTLLPAEEAVKLAKKVGPGAPMAEALYTKAAIGRYVHAAFDDAKGVKDDLASSDEAAKIFQKDGNVPGECVAELLSAEICADMGSFDKTKSHANNTLKLAKTCGDEESEKRALELLGQGPNMMPFMGGAPAPRAAPKAESSAPQAEAAAEDGASMAKAPEKKGLDHESVRETVMAITSEVVGDESEINFDLALMEAGLDSLSAINFRNKLQSSLSMKLPGTLMFDYPTARGITDFIVEASLA